MSRGREEIGPARIRKALFRAGVVTVSTPAPGVCILPGILREVPAARARASMPVPDAASQMIDAADAPPPINASDAPRSNGGDAAEFVAPPADQPNCIGDTC